MRIKIWGELRLMCITAFNANYCKCKLVKYRFCYTKLFNRNAASGYTAVSSHAVINDLRASKDARRRETLFVIAASAKTTQLVWVVCCAWCAMHLSFIKLLFYLPSGTWNFLPLLPPTPAAASFCCFSLRFHPPLRSSSPCFSASTSEFERQFHFGFLAEPQSAAQLHHVLFKQVVF